ncbi:4Fe-4S binding protein [Methanococcoides seepicolus]|jgi:MinD superfamily P-loop ATPase|uniref:4Fe-4S binding protein n=1 Tax=Methanococcoides seepicolus TaxID=2828780 RepID=A0A9E4ZHN1_9EURY|nr:4Fe-4S binding protein [Methanococcoides seepicolus]MCM1987299.1 4Fe-4S binding protein [Methanococcoides seepicolus]
MKQLTIISGKGGTGKTTIAAAFASLAENAVIADCDVDAADMHLILNPEIIETIDFYGLKEAYIDSSLCIQCGLCKENCRFDAITDDIKIDSFECEGCGVCVHICPEGAITMVERKAGEAYLSKTRFGPMAHAKLSVGEEASGKLVAFVRENSRNLAERYGKDLIIIDGPPGTGCSVIASIAGVDMVAVVTEPSVSGIHDLERVLGVASHFHIPAVVCINKYDINEENTHIIEDYCGDNGIDVVGKLPFSRIPTEAMMQEKTVMEYSGNELSGEFSEKLKDMWGNVMRSLN